MSCNDQLYEKFKDLYNRDVMNDDKDMILTNFLNAIKERKESTIKVKGKNFTGYLTITYKNDRIIISNLSRITLKEYKLDREFYNIYLDKLFNLLK